MVRSGLPLPKGDGGIVDAMMVARDVDTEKDLWAARANARCRAGFLDTFSP